MVLIELLIDGLGRANPVEDAEACIYGYGAVRFLANAVVSSDTIGSFALNSSSVAKKTKTLAYRLIQHGANPLMILHLQMINEAVIFFYPFSPHELRSTEIKIKKNICVYNDYVLFSLFRFRVRLQNCQVRLYTLYIN